MHKTPLAVAGRSDFNAYLACSGKCRFGCMDYERLSHGGNYTKSRIGCTGFAAIENRRLGKV